LTGGGEGGSNSADEQKKDTISTTDTAPSQTDEKQPARKRQFIPLEEIASRLIAKEDFPVGEQIVEAFIDEQQVQYLNAISLQFQ
jgi:hypothetical protein